MGGEVYILPKQGEAKRIKKALMVIDDDVCMAPSLGEEEKEPANCWLVWRGQRLEIGYNFGSFTNGEWAYALGQEICRRFKIRNAGWDSIGYCGVDGFMKGYPFRALMHGPKLMMKGASKENKKLFQAEIDWMKKAAKKYQKAAALIFDYKEKKNGKAKQAKSNCKADCCS